MEELLCWSGRVGGRVKGGSEGGKGRREGEVGRGRKVETATSRIKDLAGTCRWTAYLTF